jgi:serine protease Do
MKVRLSIALIALAISAAIGGMAGSLVTEKGGGAFFGPGRVIPVLAASNRASLGNQVNFENGFAPVVKRALPAVVSISSSKLVKTAGGSEFPFSEDPLFRQFFGNQFNMQPRQEREHSLGSGVVISPDGYILTNNHVVDQATDIKVTFLDKRELKARVIGKDPQTDLAVLKVGARDLQALPLGDSSKMEAGDFVLAIGNPFGLSETVTMGIISATGRRGLDIENYENFLQTDAAINPGNSGGALMNADGSLIGINTAILAGNSGGNQGVGFAIPINMARLVMDQILKSGKVVRGYLGVTIQDVTPAMAKAFGLKEAQGVVVADVSSDSPAAKAGVERGDVILALNGKPVSESAELRLETSMTKPGTVVQLKISRNGSERNIPVTLGELPAKGEPASGETQSSTGLLTGVKVEALTPDIAGSLQLPVGTRGVVVDSVDPASSAADAGLERGDVIQEVNHKAVTTVDAFRNAVREAGNGPVLLLINRNGATIYVAVGQ